MDGPLFSYSNSQMLKACYHSSYCFRPWRDSRLIDELLLFILDRTHPFKSKTQSAETVMSSKLILNCCIAMVIVRIIVGDWIRIRDVMRIYWVSLL